MKWISVADRLPPEGELVYLKGYKRSYVGKIFTETNQGKSFINFYVEGIFKPLEKASSYASDHEDLKNIFWLDESRTYKEPTDQQKEEYFNKLLSKLKQQPHFKERQELGKLLMKHIDSFTPKERKRYDELLKILK